jgi:hypothetical protein
MFPGSVFNQTAITIDPLFESAALAVLGSDRRT